MDSIISVSKLSKKFSLGKISVPALNNVDLQINQGEFVALVGHSGSGKSTLLNIIGGLCPATAGEVVIHNVAITKLSENEICLFRRKNIGFVFQSYNLLQKLTAVENVEMPLIFSGVSKNERRERADKMLDLVGLSERKLHKPNELSGGQQQRVSIARALINNPSIVLADEPTGNLDSNTSIEILDLMKKMNNELNMTFVVVTHDYEAVDFAHRVIHMKDGIITKEDKREDVI